MTIGRSIAMRAYYINWIRVFYPKDPEHIPAARFGNAGGVLLDPLVLMVRLLHKYVQWCISMAMLGTLNNVSWA